MAKQQKQPSGSDGGKKSPVMNRGILAGIAILILAVIVFAAILVLNFGNATNANCNTQTGACALPTTQATPVPTGPMKMARPSVELYVMSFCPYGVQMENAMRPVVALLANSTDFRVRYIVSVPGTDISTAHSLHGNAEVVEDTRQLCIAEKDPEKLWDYIAAFNSRCYPVNATTLSSCQDSVETDLGIPRDSISQCVAGSDGFGLLKAEASAVDNAGISSSPTLIINGQRYSGSRTPDAIRQAICDHFDTAPGSCATTLSSTTASASGNC